MPDSDARTDEGSLEMPDFGDNVDISTFTQILEMDDDEADRDFSRPLVFNFFEQAEETFGKMDNALANEDLAELSSLGHFLKGSSATLGFIKVRDNCQVIQQYGHKLNLDGAPEPDEKVCLRKITEALQAAKDDTAKLETMIKKFFGEGSD